MADFLNFKRAVNSMTRNPDRGVLQTVGINKTMLTVPNLIGMTSAAAIAAIAAAGFVVGTNTVSTTVASQSLVAGTKTVVHAQINIA
jgi:beta-lactam-binding protein with PASTA domain